LGGNERSLSNPTVLGGKRGTEGGGGGGYDLLVLMGPDLSVNASKFLVNYAREGCENSGRKKSRLEGGKNVIRWPISRCLLGSRGKETACKVEGGVTSLLGDLGSLEDMKKRKKRVVA